MKNMKKQAVKQLREASDEFIANFLAVNKSAIPLRSKDPGLCWRSTGQIFYVAMNEFSGPNAMEDDAPVLIRLRTNMYPPPAMFYHLRSPAVRHKLGVAENPPIAQEPALEITAKPGEIGKFGRWLTAWFDSQFFQREHCPTPPISLTSWRVTSDLQDEMQKISDMGLEWRQHLYLWTEDALKDFKQWLVT